MTHDAHGLVSQYRVTSGLPTRLDIANRYAGEGREERLESFRVEIRDARGAAAVALEANLGETIFDAALDATAFAPPQSTRDVKKKLSDLWDQTVAVEYGMSVEDLAGSLQRAVGKDFQVRVDREAFDRAPEPGGAALALEPGNAKLSDLLFDDLRANQLDFYCDLQGISLIPSWDSWKHTDVVDYAAKDYGLDLPALQRAIRAGAISTED